MNGFEFWISLVLGVCFTISSIIGLYNDFKEKATTKWWKWVLDPLGLIVGLGFICEFCFLR